MSLKNNQRMRKKFKSILKTSVSSENYVSKTKEHIKFSSIWNTVYWNETQLHWNTLFSLTTCKQIICNSKYESWKRKTILSLTIFCRYINQLVLKYRKLFEYYIYDKDEIVVIMLKE